MLAIGQDTQQRLLASPRGLDFLTVSDFLLLMAQASEASNPREKVRRPISFQDIPPDITQCHFCHILLADQLVILVQIPGEGAQVPSFSDWNVREFVDMFKNHQTGSSYHLYVQENTKRRYYKNPQLWSQGRKTQCWRQDMAAQDSPKGHCSASPERGAVQIQLLPSRAH